MKIHLFKISLKISILIQFQDRNSKIPTNSLQNLHHILKSFRLNSFKQNYNLLQLVLNYLQVKFQQLTQQKEMQIRDLSNKNKKLDEQLQRMSSFSQNNNNDINFENKQDKKFPIIDQLHYVEQEKVTKQNLSDFILTSINNFNIVESIRSIVDSDNSSKISKISQQNALLKLWQKQIKEHILPRTKMFSISSFVKKQVHLQKFIKTTSLLVRKHYGIPHIYRNKVWQFILEDNLGISNAFYIELLDRRNRGWVSQKIKIQIQKDIIRSFNGEGSKQKLLKIHELTLQKTKSSPPINLEDQNQLTQNPIQNPNKIYQQNRTSKQIQPTDHFTSQISQNFRIAQDVTQVLELFYIYRPDIGFVQGMTYPTIVLTLVTGKISAFRILCNILLCNEFFRRMITFQPNFINYFCRIFDQLLLAQNLSLYNLIFNQYQIRSQVFLVDWFFTFFSRGISPNTILRIWDLFLYQFNLSMKNPQLIIYKVSLTIFNLLQPILLHTTYQQCIQTIREYSKKIDQQQLIRRLYNQMKDSSLLKSFQEKYIKIKNRVQKKYYGNNELQ